MAVLMWGNNPHYVHLHCSFMFNFNFKCSSSSGAAKYDVVLASSLYSCVRLTINLTYCLVCGFQMNLQKGAYIGYLQEKVLVI